MSIFELSDEELKKQFFEVLQYKIQNDKNEFDKNDRLTYYLHHYEDGKNADKKFIGRSRAELWYIVYLYKLRPSNNETVLLENGELTIIKKENKFVDDLFKRSKECLFDIDEDEDINTSMEQFVTESVNMLFENDTEWLRICYPHCYKLNIYT